MTTINKKEYSNIVDAEAHALWVAEREKPAFQNNTYTLSTGVIIPGKRMLISILDDISDLPDEERNKVLAWYKKHKRASKRVRILFTQAFGGANEQKKEEERQEEKRSYNVLLSKKSIVIKLFGSLYTIDEIYSIMRERYNIACSIKDLHKFRAEHDPQIEAACEKFRDDGEINDIRMFFKRARAEELNEMYQKRKRIYEQSEDRNDERALLEIIASLRKEVEGEKATVTNVLNLNLDQNINNHINASGMVQNLPMQDIVIAKLAEKNNIAPQVLLNAIHNTRYSKAIDADAKPDYPSESNYNFDELAHLIESREKHFFNVDLEAQAKEIVIQTKAPDTNLKNKLLSMIKSKKIAEE